MNTASREKGGCQPRMLGVRFALANVNVPGCFFAVFGRWPEVELHRANIGVASELLHFLDRRPVLKHIMSNQSLITRNGLTENIAYFLTSYVRFWRVYCRGYKCSCTAVE